ncbi:acyltransferase family protein [Sphingopyxis sp. P1IMeth2]|uniref:acyltransferase family protein n=1 Tax=Sphingopyxis sp. P1IMeth2 TaxID=1892848 RepID=UPI001648C52E|nr:acyltransferase [Sphingopyxis sp. P1IMeth2]
MGNSTGQRIQTLDGFRALAILLVTAFHFTITFTAPRDPLSHIPVTSPFSGFLPFEYGWIGVELFFVISGFVILMTLRKSAGILDFARRRIARIWPPLIVAATLTAIIVRIIGPQDWHTMPQDYVASLLLLDPKFMAIAAPDLPVKWVDPVYWSLAVEIRFYAVAAAIYAVSREAFIRNWLIWQAAVAFAALIIGTEGMGGLIITVVGMPKYLPYFTFGICCYEIWSQGSERRWALAGATLPALLVLEASLFHADTRSPLVLVVANTAIFSLFVLFLRGSSTLAIFSSRPMLLIGQTSYSFYLIHDFIGVSLIRLFVIAGAPLLVAVPIVYGICLAAAVAMFRSIEMRGKDLVMRWTDRLTRPQLVRNL